MGGTPLFVALTCTSTRQCDTLVRENNAGSTLARMGPESRPSPQPRRLGACARRRPHRTHRHTGKTTYDLHGRLYAPIPPGFPEMQNSPERDNERRFTGNGYSTRSVVHKYMGASRPLGGCLVGL